MKLRTRVFVLGLGLELAAAALVWTLPASTRAQLASARWFVVFGPTLGLGTITTVSWTAFFLAGTIGSMWVLGVAAAANTRPKQVAAFVAFIVLWLFFGIIGTTPYT